MKKVCFFTLMLLLISGTAFAVVEKEKELVADVCINNENYMIQLRPESKS